ncbi:MAG TPA: hypothetical protein DEH78_20260 [Solibacterales bacterium]|nr:hypothetical protein [Bryobacterales bacterium]
MSQALSTTVVIANAASLSAAGSGKLNKIKAIGIPAAWTAAALTFQVSKDNSTFMNLYDAAGEVSIASAAVVASGVVGLSDNLQAILGEWPYFKIRSGTAGTPVAQGADRTLTVYLG